MSGLVVQAHFGYTCADCGENCDRSHFRWVEDGRLVVMCPPCTDANRPPSRESEGWSLQAEMDLRDAEASDAYREFVNDHVREA